MPKAPTTTPSNPKDWESFWSKIKKGKGFNKLPKETRADMLVLGADLYLLAARSNPESALKRSLALWCEATKLVPTHDPHWTPYRLHNYLMTLWKLFELNHDQELLKLLEPLADRLAQDKRTKAKDRHQYQLILGLALVEQCRSTDDCQHLLRAIEGAIDLLVMQEAIAQVEVLVGRILKEVATRRESLLSRQGFRAWLDSAFPRLAPLKDRSPKEAVCAMVGFLFQFYSLLPVADSMLSAAAFASAIFDTADRNWACFRIAYFDLALVFRNLHQHAANREYLDRAIEHMHRAIECSPADMSGTGYYELGRMLNQRAMAFGTYDDLDGAVSAFESALRHKDTDNIHNDARRVLNVTRLVRGVLGKSSEGVNELQLLGTIEKVTNEDERTANAQTLGFFALALGHRYEQTGNLADLDRSVALAVVAYSYDGQDPCIIGMLATALLARYSRTANHLDLDNALSALRRIAIDRVSDRNLAANLHEKMADALEYERARGGGGDIPAEVVRLRRECVRLIDRANPLHSRALAKLAGALFFKSQIEDTSEDFCEAMQVFDDASAAATDKQTAELIQANRALALQAKARTTGRTEEWAEAIDELRKSAERQVGLPTPDRPKALDNFLRALLRRFRTFGQIQDLRECISLGEVGLTEAREARAEGSMEHQIGHQVLWYRVYEDVVDAYLTLAEVEPESARTGLWRALEISESVKGDVFLSTFGLNAGGAEAFSQAFHDRADVPTAVDTLVKSALGLRSAKSPFQEVRVSLEDFIHFRERLSPDTAIVTAFCSELQTWWFVLTADRDEPLVIKTSISRSQWPNIVLRASREMALEATLGDETWLAGLQPLRVLGPPLKSVKRLILSPHQWTGRLPWAVLARRLDFRSSDGKPLSVRMVPNLKFAVSPHEPKIIPNGDALVVGNPRGDLGHASEEAREVAALLSVPALIGAAATVEAVSAQLEQARIIHFASHAELIDSPDHVRLHLADGHLSMGDILARRVAAKLVVLSACCSGVTQRIGREEIIGLPEAFLIAGAESVVAALWSVEDASTARLMRGFYARWLGGQDVADALNAAIDELSAQPQWQHPHWWGAFFATGRSVPLLSHA